MNRDPHDLYADHIAADEPGRLTVNGRRATGHPSTVVLDLDEMSDGELLYAAHAFLTVLYQRWPREACAVDRTHERTTA